MKRTGLVIGIGVVVVAAIVLLVVKLRGDDPVQYDTYTVARGRVVAKVTASGTLSALVTVQVGSQVSGRIENIPKGVDFNAVVKKGDLVAKIDPQLFEAALDQAKANYEAALANLQKAKVQAVDAERIAKRSAALAADKLIAVADRDTAQATADAARAQVTSAAAAVEQAKASLQLAQVNLDYTTIVSPIDGVIISRNVDIGQTVASALQTPTLFTIAEDLKKMQVDTSVAEGDVGRLSSGMPTSFTVDAYPGERFVGTVRQIRNSPTTVQNVVTYDAVIDVDNSKLRLKPGMTANVTFVWAEKDDTLVVPNSALRFRPPGAPAPGRTRGAGGGAGGGGGGGGHRGSGGGAGGGSGAWAGSGAGGASGEHRHRRHDQDAGAPAPGGSPSAESTTTQPATQPAAAAPAPDVSPRRGGGAESDVKTLWVLRGPEKTLTPVQVKTGITDGSITEIVDGDLHEGDLVVTDIASGGSSAARPANPLGPSEPPRGGGRRGF